MGFTIGGDTYSYRMSIPVANPTSSGDRAIDAIPFPAWFLSSSAMSKIVDASSYTDVRVTKADGSSTLPCEVGNSGTRLYVDYPDMPVGRTSVLVAYGCATASAAASACTFKTQARETAGITASLS